MLQLNNVRLRRGERVLFENASLQAHAGQRLGITGVNGSGKSSLFALVLGGLEADAGEVSLPAGIRIAHVSQTSPTGERSALDHVMDGDRELRAIQSRLESPQADVQHSAYAELEAVDGYTAPSRAARLLHGLGFRQEEIHRPVGSFSGGWRMRLNLAQALMCRSDLLLLDEPTNHLDLPAILWLESWLLRYPGILLLISHDRDFLDAVCTRIAHIEQQQVKLYTGNYSQFEEARSQQLALEQSLYERQQKEIRHIQGYIDRFRYKASKARQAQSRLRMLDRMVRIAPAHVDSPFRFEFLEPLKQPRFLLRLEDGCAGYSPDPPVLRGLNLGINADQRIGLLGSNGAGKSTLVKALVNGGTLLAGQRICHRDTRIGYFAQHEMEQLDPRLSPMDHLRAQEPGGREQELRTYLGRFGFEGERIFAPVEPFSGGEKARLVLALLIRLRPNLLLLDEPTNHLDLEMRQALAMALSDYSGAMLLISHDRHLLRSACEELWIVHDGQVECSDMALDEFPAWLAAREAAAQASAGPQTPPTGAGAARNRRAQRQESALARQRLQPLRDRARKAEQDIAGLRADLERIGLRLADQALYCDPSRRDELAGLLRLQGEQNAALVRAEQEWLEAGLALEQLPSASSD